MAAEVKGTPSRNVPLAVTAVLDFGEHPTRATDAQAELPSGIWPI